MKLKAAELCAGYGGLASAIEQVFGAETAWFSEFEAAPSKILARHWPGVPNHGDMTKIDWDAVEPVDIISGGTPCQDLSGAGRRAGMTDGTRSNLWVQMRESIAVIKPTYVIWENVRGAYSAKAYSDLEQCAGCMGGGGNGEPVLRALGRVLGDLSDLGYDCQWRGLRAADVGAPHGRFRVFVLATRRPIEDALCVGSGGGATITSDGETPRADTPPHRTGDRPSEPGTVSEATTTDTNHTGRGKQRRTIPIREEHTTTEHAGIDAADSDSIGRERAGSAWRRRDGLTDDSEPPTDTSSSTIREYPGESPTQEAWAGSRNGSGDHRGERLDGDGREVASVPEGIGGREGRPEYARIERRPNAVLSSDTPTTDTEGQRRDNGDPGDLGATCGTRNLPINAGHATAGPPRAPETNWGEYAPAIRRWESALGRRAPAPTEPTGRNGGHRLSARFAEFMMGCPDGWIVDTPGVSRNEALKAAGNGVVTQQAVAALQDMLRAAQ